MTEGHYAVLLCVAVVILGSLVFVLRVQPKGWLYRFVQRSFWAYLMVWLMQNAGFVPLNLFTWGFSSLFGLPGAAVLMAILQY